MSIKSCQIHFKALWFAAKEAKIRGYAERIQLGCLLHDASENYVSDLTRSVKVQLPAYVAIEKRNVHYGRQHFLAKHH